MKQTIQKTEQCNKKKLRQFNEQLLSQHQLFNEQVFSFSSECDEIRMYMREDKFSHSIRKTQFNSS